MTNSSTSLPSCQLTCLNGGYCNYLTSDFSTLLQIFTSGGLLHQCICPPGYTGLSCETVVEECSLPKLTCHNGMACELKGGDYVCDCSEADALSDFAGSMCRNPKTTYCGSGEIVNRSFCTNGGLCLENLRKGMENEFDTHKGCKCPPEFEGEHCEYIKGMAPTIVKDMHTVISSITELEKEVEIAELEKDMESKTAYKKVAKISPASVAHSKKSVESSASNAVGSLPVPNSHVASSASESKPVFKANTITTSTTQKPDSITVGASHLPTNTTSAPSRADAGNIAGLVLSVMGITLFGTFMAIRKRKQRKLRTSHNAAPNHLACLNRENYQDETPIRVRICPEDDNVVELDEIMGEEDDVVSIGECSLEEIELDGEVGGNYAEYLRGISDDFGGYDDRVIGGELEKIREEDEEEVQSGSGGYFPNIFV